MSLNLTTRLKKKEVDPLLYINEELELCDSCKGLGTYQHVIREDYHHRTEDTETRTCGTCDGFGRYYKQTLKLGGIRKMSETK